MLRVATKRGTIVIHNCVPINFSNRREKILQHTLSKESITCVFFISISLHFNFDLQNIQHLPNTCEIPELPKTFSEPL